ncbi:MAG: hypothetical protein H6Q10_1030 [Acidobacteria bacterium]|nr:hypothetical protein [Acidobacteriota bacterium]
MPSVADGLRRELRDRVAAMSPAERIELTARLAEWDLDMYCAARGVSRDEGRRQLVRARQEGRLPSRVAREVDA